MNTSIKHWGEPISTSNEQQQTIDVSADIEKSMNKFCLAEFDTDSNDGQKLDHILLSSMDPLMLHAISLHKYANNLAEKIRVAEDSKCSNYQLDPAPNVPKFVNYKRKHIRNSLNYIEKDFVSEASNRNVHIPEISDAIAKQILTKCVAVMFAQIGYETTNQSVLDFMTDVLEDILKQICHKIKVACEDELNDQSVGFPNVIERVFVDIGLNGATGLHDYYETRVVKYINVLYKRCQHLKEHYEKLLAPKSALQTDKNSKVIYIKKEDDNEENPELHLENVDLGSTLEPGYELLNSLDAGTDLEEGVINVVASTSGTVSLPGMEIISSPLSKKKRK